MPQLDPKMGEFYRYYKGGMVRIFMLATHTETGERLVVYQRLSARYETFATPYSRFIGEVDFKKHPACPDRFRFTYVPTESLEPNAASPEWRPAEPQAREEAKEAKERFGEDPLEKAPEATPAEPETRGKLEEKTKDPADKWSASSPEGGRAPVERKSLTDLMLDFLDERDFEKKDGILAEMATRPDLSDGLIDNLAAAMDLVIDDGQPTERRFAQLRYCVRTRARFENTRLR